MAMQLATLRSIPLCRGRFTANPVQRSQYVSRYDKRMSCVSIQGHFHRPSIENPFLDAIEVQDTADSYRDRNKRVEQSLRCNFELTKNGDLACKALKDELSQLSDRLKIFRP